MRMAEELKMASVFLVWLTKCMVVPGTEMRSLGEKADMLGFEHIVLEMVLRHLSINVQWEVDYRRLGLKRYSHRYM